MDMNPPTENKEPVPTREEDEINLLDLILVPLKQQKMIVGIVLLTAVTAVVVSLLLPNRYQSTAIIMPQSDQEMGGSPLSGIKVSPWGGLLGLAADETAIKYRILLKSRWLTEKVIKKHNLLKEIYCNKWNESKKEWTTDTPPTLQDAYLLISSSLLNVAVNSKSGTISVSFISKIPERAKEIVEYYLEVFSITLRQMVLEETRENIRFFNEELAKTSDVLLRDKINEMVSREIERQTFTKAQKYFSFVVLEPPLVSDPNKAAEPNRSLICITSVLVAFFFAVSLAFFLEYLSNFEKDEASAKRLHAMRTELHIDFFKTSISGAVRKVQFWKRKK